MIAHSHIKKGLLVWWRRIGNSSNQNINCPCVISKVDKDGYNVISFDDFQESEFISFRSEAHKKEITTTTKDQVMVYLEGQRNALELALKKADEEALKCHESHNLFLKKLVRFSRENPGVL